MKIWGQFYFIFSLLFLSSCLDNSLEEASLEGWNPSLCTEKSSEGCGVDWFIAIKGDSIPKDMQIILNDVVVIDECDPKSNWTATSISDVKEFQIRDYVDLKGTEKINLRIFDLKECQGKKTEKGFYAEQSYTLKNVAGKKRITIERAL